jgi:hypothetical protein
VVRILGVEMGNGFIADFNRFRRSFIMKPV